MSMFVWILRSLRTGFWALPAAMTLGAAVLAVVMIALDAEFGGAFKSSATQPFLVTAESAGRILSVIAGSMITVTSLVFSTTLIALTLAATNIGPRLVERFMEDRVTQISLGVFVATFVYSLLVLRAVKGGDASPFIPHLSVNLALLMAILSFGWLIFSSTGSPGPCKPTRSSPRPAPILSARLKTSPARAAAWPIMRRAAGSAMQILLAGLTAPRSPPI